MVRGLTVNQVYDVKVDGRSSRPCRANKNFMLVVQWWRNHLKNLRALAQSDRVYGKQSNTLYMGVRQLVAG